jgi:phytoene dehydrogenase-like protein
LRGPRTRKPAKAFCWARLFALLSFTLPFVATSTAATVTASIEYEGGRFYPETGRTLASEFVTYFDERGGVPTFGYPITEARAENGYLVQWTERERL